MTLILRPITQADVPTCVSIRTASLGSLVIGRPPPYPGFVEQQEAGIRHDLDNAPHVHHLIVVDTSSGETIAYAKFEVYPEGRQDLVKMKKPLSEEDKSVDQYERLREAAHDYFCSRNGGQMGSRPHILLALLVTIGEHRRRGAGSLLVKWGIDHSERLGIPCYLQASEQGAQLYKSHGFEVIDIVPFDLSKYGMEGVEYMTEMVRYSAYDTAVTSCDTCR